MRKKYFKAVELNKLDQRTITQIRNWRNQDFVRFEMFNQNIIEAEEHIKWIETVKNDNKHHLFVFYLDDEPFAVAQSRYYPEYGYVETGDYLISEDFQSLGYGTFTSYFLSKILFEILGYKKIHSEIICTNERNVRMIKRFKKEENVHIENKYINGFLYKIYVVDTAYDEWKNLTSEKLGRLVFRFIEEAYDVIL